MKILRRIWDYMVIAVLLALAVIDDIREEGWEDSDDK